MQNIEIGIPRTIYTNEMLWMSTMIKLNVFKSILYNLKIELASQLHDDLHVYPLT